MVGVSKLPLRKGTPDDFQTPKEAIDILIPYLKKEWKIWECASGKGNIVKALQEKGFDVYGSDIIHNSVCDFLTWRPCQKVDCIITNPPYSLKEKFLERCYELKKPFALLMPLTALESEKRQKLYRKYGVQLIIPNKRFNFEIPSGNGGGSWFATAWFCGNMNLPSQINFIELQNGNKN